MLEDIWKMFKVFGGILEAVWKILDWMVFGKCLDNFAQTHYDLIYVVMAFYVLKRVGWRTSSGFRRDPPNPPRVATYSGCLLGMVRSPLWICCRSGELTLLDHGTTRRANRLACGVLCDICAMLVDKRSDT